MPGAELLQRLMTQMEELRASVDTMRNQLDASRRESADLRRELDSMRQQLGGALNSQVVTSVPDTSGLKEDQELLNAKVDDQYQTKIESGSKYRVRLSGLALINALSTRGSVDSLDLPRYAISRRLGDSKGSFAVSARQSRLDLQVFGPEWNGAKTTGDMSFDFWGGFPTTSEGLTSGLIRLRTARLSLDFANTTIVAGQDTPFFSPGSPTSLASSSYPAFSSAGNIWTWTPEIHVEHRVALSEKDKVSIRAGILDALTGEIPTDYDRSPTAGERGRMPAYATHFAWQRDAGDRPFTAGIGTYYSRQNWRFGRTVDAWAATADWDLPLHKRFSFSGEFYRGRAIGGLGAGASGSVLLRGPLTASASTVFPLNSAGGWSQLKFQATPKIEFNTAYGEDQPYRSDLLPLLLQRSIDGYPVKRNSSGFVNVILQPRSSLLFSIEYRRLWSNGFYDPRRTADHFSFTSGIVF